MSVTLQENLYIRKFHNFERYFKYMFNQSKQMFARLDDIRNALIRIKRVLGGLSTLVILEFENQTSLLRFKSRWPVTQNSPPNAKIKVIHNSPYKFFPFYRTRWELHRRDAKYIDRALWAIRIFQNRYIHLNCCTALNYSVRLTKSKNSRRKITSRTGSSLANNR